MIPNVDMPYKSCNPHAKMLRKLQEIHKLAGPGNYKLYWNYTLDGTGNGNISFAVYVNSTGWVGLGISINGSMHMIHSDIGMGWMTADGQPAFTVGFHNVLS